MEEYVNVVVFQTIYYYYKDSEGNIVVGQNDTELDIVRCPSGRFKGSGKNDKILGIKGTYLCIKDMNFTIQGSYASAVNHLLTINVFDCN